MTPSGAAVIGSGPNGLAAAVTLARAGIPVTLFEASPTLGGGLRTTVDPEDGMRRDLCSAIHPLALATGFFRAFELEQRVEFVVPEASYAHPLDNAPAAIAYRDLQRASDGLGADADSYRRFFAPLVSRVNDLVETVFAATQPSGPRSFSTGPLTAVRILEQSLARLGRFRGAAAPALLTGVAAHSQARIPGLAAAAVGTVLGVLGHARGWPVPIGGSQAIADALVNDLMNHGGLIHTGHRITDIGELDSFPVVMFDTSAAAFTQIAQRRLPAPYLRQLRRFRYGPGATKVDFVLDAPVPWFDPRVHDAATVHVGGMREEIIAAEREVQRGRHPAHPFVLLAQPDRTDPQRNPSANVIWSYTHVPAGSTVDVGPAVIAQIERFAPGFHERIRSVRVTTAAALAEYNPNYVGGDIGSGAVTTRQLLMRPTFGSEPWRTPARGVYLCSSSTRPGPGVHGLSGWYAARTALRREWGLPAPGLSR